MELSGVLEWSLKTIVDCVQILRSPIHRSNNVRAVHYI